jgi:hypothetical protein
MITIRKHTGWAVGAAVMALGVGLPGVFAQSTKTITITNTRSTPSQAPRTSNPFFQIKQGLAISNASLSNAQKALATRGLASVPPGLVGASMLGFNPFNPFNRGTFPALTATSPFLTTPFGTTPFGVGGVTNPYTAALTSTGALPFNAGYDASLYSNPYGENSNPYGNYGESQLGGYVRGVADVVNATGRLMINEQQAHLLRQKVKQEQLETWKKGFDYWLYYRDHMPTAEDDRQRAVQLQVRRAQNAPPVGEIYSGQSLNTLLDDLQKKMTKDADFRNPALPLDDEALNHLNITPAQGGNPGILKNEGKFQWPQALNGPQFKEDRTIVSDLSPTIYDQVVRNRLDAGTLEAITAAVRRMEQQLTDSIRDLTPTQYAEARRFLSNFQDALALVKKPGSGEYFNAKALKGKTVGELVQYMLNRGLRFAPALPGDEPAYVAVHRGLIVFASNVNPQVATEQRPAPEPEK